MKAFETTIAINAPAERVWALLTDAPSYPAWNTALLGIKGTIAAGEKIKVSAARPKGEFPETVTEFAPPTRMVWSSRLPLGLFEEAWTFTIEPLADEGGVRFGMREVFRGPLSPVLARSIPDLQPDLERFAAELKAAAEKQA